MSAVLWDTRTYVRTYVRTYIRTYVHTYVHTYTNGMTLTLLVLSQLHFESVSASSSDWFEMGVGAAPSKRITPSLLQSMGELMSWPSLSVSLRTTTWQGEGAARDFPLCLPVRTVERCDQCSFSHMYVRIITVVTYVVCLHGGLILRGLKESLAVSPS